MNKFTATALSAFLLLGASFGAKADATTDSRAEARHPLLTDTFVLSAGAYLHTKSLKLRVDGSSPAEIIDFDERWNFDGEQSRFAGEILWRFGEKWSFRGQYFDSTDSGNAVLDEDLTWGDYTLDAGSNVGASVEFSVARLFFGRNFSTGPRHEFGLGLGVHWMEIGASLEGEFSINDMSSGVQRKKVSAGAPLPNLGAWYSFAMTPKWLLKTRVDWLSVNIDEYDGGFTNLSAGVQYQAFKHFGIGLSYQYFSLDVDVDKDTWHGAVDLSYRGPVLFATANW